MCGWYDVWHDVALCPCFGWVPCVVWCSWVLCVTWYRGWDVDCDVDRHDVCSLYGWNWLRRNLKLLETARLRSRCTILSTLCHTTQSHWMCGQNTHIVLSYKVSIIIISVFYNTQSFINPKFSAIALEKTQHKTQKGTVRPNFHGIKIIHIHDIQYFSYLLNIKMHYFKIKKCGNTF